MGVNFTTQVLPYLEPGNRTRVADAILDAEPARVGPMTDELQATLDAYLDKAVALNVRYGGPGAARFLSTGAPYREALQALRDEFQEARQDLRDEFQASLVAVAEKHVGG